MLYDDVLGSYKISIITKYCNHCKHTYYPGYFENWKEKERQYYAGWSSYGIFVSTICSAFSIDLLHRLVCMKQKCHNTFIGKAASYNLHHSYKDSDEVLDKRRLSEGYYKYTFISFKERYNLPLDIHDGIDSSLKNQFASMYDVFQKKYGSHACNIPGCEDCLVIDGNMKAHRKLCKSHGCQEDPGYKSQFCKDHIDVNSRDIVNGAQQLKDGEFHIEKIVKKVTRGKRHLYEISWKGYEEHTFEPRENIPRILVELFERYGDSTISTTIQKRCIVDGIEYINVHANGDIFTFNFHLWFWIQMHTLQSRLKIMKTHHVTPSKENHDSIIALVAFW